MEYTVPFNPPTEDDGSYEESLYISYLEDGYTSEEASEMAREDIETMKEEARQQRMCCPNGCKGYC